MLIPAQAQTVSWGCLGMSTAEVILPGLGFLIAGEPTKAAAYGLPRWFLSTADVGKEKHDSKDVAKTYYTGDGSGKDTTLRIYYNKETWEKNRNLGAYMNLGLISFWDLHTNDCQLNNSGYAILGAPLQFKHFYKNWGFWLPLGLLAALPYDKKIEYHLGTGLKKDQLYKDTAPTMYLVGIAEEAFFRGVVHKSFYAWYLDNWQLSKHASRWTALFSSATIFSVAHNGAGNTANMGGAFLFGLYFGYLYHPSANADFDIITPAALHSWWNTMVAYQSLNHAKFYETDERVDEDSGYPERAVAGTVQIPLIQFDYEF